MRLNCDSNPLVTNEIRSTGNGTTYWRISRDLICIYDIVITADFVGEAIEREKLTIKSAKCNIVQVHKKGLNKFF